VLRTHVVGRFTDQGVSVKSEEKRRGKGGRVETGKNQKPVSSDSHTPLEIPQTTRDSHFSTAPAADPVLKTI
jgi:hypothetical protein